MNTLSKTLLLILLRLFVVAAFAKALAVALLFILPYEGVEPPVRPDVTPGYVRVDFASLFQIATQKKQTDPNADRSQSSFDAASIDDLVLKGLYGKEEKGFAVVAKRNQSQKNVIVAVGERFGGYTLKAIKLGYVVFEKDAKLYRLELEKIKTQPQSNARYANSGDTPVRTVTKKDIEYFAAHPRDIWKNISIREVRKRNGKLKGFEVRWIRQNSKFASLGLQKGDLIVKVNNKRLRSYKDAIEIYKNISKINEIAIVVLRNGEEKELVYAID